MYNLRIAAIYQLFLKNCPSLWTNQSAGSESPANQRAREPVSVFTHAQGVLWPSFHHRIHTIRRFGGWVFRKFKNEDMWKVFCLASKIKFWWLRGPLHIVQTKQCIALQRDRCQSGEKGISLIQTLSKTQRTCEFSIFWQSSCTNKVKRIFKIFITKPPDVDNVFLSVKISNSKNIDQFWIWHLHLPESHQSSLLSIKHEWVNNLVTRQCD